MKKKLLTFFAFALPFFIFSQNIALEAFGPDFDRPTNIKNAGDSRLFIVEQAGKIKILNPDGSSPATPFLDITSIVTQDINSNWESGLLGLTFHPNYATNGFFYVLYSNTALNPVISRFKVSDSDPNEADPNSELILIQLSSSSGVHLGGELAFGSDGYLYISMGDGGTGSGDVGDPDHQAQDLNKLFGKILRIDVDNPANGNNYGIPATNPYNDGDSNTRGEIWEYGFRNPHHFSFDPPTGDLWIADVGHNNYEEINVDVGNTGNKNFGWRCFEANEVYEHAPGSCPGFNTITAPTSILKHSNPDEGCSVVGGYRYRGSNYPQLAGKYLFADWCKPFIYILTEDNGSWTRSTYDHTADGLSLENWVAFGQDQNNELYIIGNNLFDGPPNGGKGKVYKIKEETLSSKKIEKETNFRIVPNPSNTDWITLNFVKNISLKEIAIYNAQGQKVITKSKSLNSKTFEIGISNLSSGIYIVETTSKNGEKAQNKLIIK